jgi:hypothetical protein
MPRLRSKPSPRSWELSTPWREGLANGGSGVAGEQARLMLRKRGSLCAKRPVPGPVPCPARKTIACIEYGCLKERLFSSDRQRRDSIEEFEGRRQLETAAVGSGRPATPLPPPAGPQFHQGKLRTGQTGGLTADSGAGRVECRPGRGGGQRLCQRCRNPGRGAVTRRRPACGRRSRRGRDSSWRGQSRRPSAGRRNWGGRRAWTARRRSKGCRPVAPGTRRVR